MEEYDRYLNLLYVREVNFGKQEVHYHKKGKFSKLKKVELLQTIDSHQKSAQLATTQRANSVYFSTLIRQNT